MYTHWLPTWAIVFLMVLYSASVSAQTDTVFWFAAPDVTSGHSDEPIALRLINLDNSNTITIDQPANGSFVPIVVNLTANSSTSVDLTPYISDIESGASLAITQKGIRISAPAKFQAFFEVVSNNYNRDIFTLKGNNGIGTEFVVAGQNQWYTDSTRFNPMARAELCIVSTEDGNLITVNTSSEVEGSASKTFSFTLDKGESVSVKSKYNGPTQLLSGSIIESAKGVSVTLSEDSSVKDSYGGCADLMGDQLVPTHNLGDEYFIVRGGIYRYFLIWLMDDVRDYIFVTGVEDKTLVTYDNGSFIVNRGETIGILMNTSTNTTESLTGNKKFAVSQVSGYGCEVGMAMIPPVSCNGSKSIEVYRTTTESFYLVVIVAAGGESDFTTQPSNLFSASDFSSIHNSNYMYMRKSFSTTEIPVNTSIKVENGTEPFQLAVVNGGASTGCSFGYFTDFIQLDELKVYHY